MRSTNDIRNWNNVIGTVMYQHHPKDKNQIRTYHFVWNALSERCNVQVSNYHHATPTPDMKPFNQRVIDGVIRMSR
mgnify:CR=1 FL=1